MGVGKLSLLKAVDKKKSVGVLSSRGVMDRVAFATARGRVREGDVPPPTRSAETFTIS